jgi:MFS family permease
VNIIGCVLYALGSTTDWIGTVLIGRMISGIVGGPSYSATYVSRTTDHKTRSLYMQYVGVSIGIGYGIGPLLGSAVTEICNRAGWNSDLMNENTASGWLMAILFVIEAILLTFFLVDPRRDTERSVGVVNDDVNKNKKKNKNSEISEITSKPPSVPWTRVLLTFVTAFIVPLNVGALEVHTVAVAET